ncbi:MAG: pseudouridine synthase [Phycisphaerales bacterium]
MPDRKPRRHEDRGNQSRPGRDEADRGRGIARGVRIVLEDDDLLVVDKPCGMLSAYVGGPRGEGYEGDDLFSLVKKYVRSRARSRARLPVYVVHRLDREVSGLMIFAKSERALHWLKEDLRARRLSRLYFAVVEGEIPTTGPGSSGTIQSYLRENSKGVVESSSTPPPATASRGNDGPDEAKLAVTHWRSVNSGRGHSLLQIRLETGRKNQIRVHMKELGHSIAGDRRYGATTDPIKRVCLHAGELGFVHAFAGRPMKLKSPIPREFFKLVGAGRDEAVAIEQGGADAPAESQAVSAAESKSNSKAISDAGWDHVAGWYDKLIEEGRSDHFEKVIIPGTLRLLEPSKGQRILDVACGQGAFCRTIARLGAQVTGVDAAPKLIEAAKRAARDLRPAPNFEVGDARNIGDARFEGEPFDSATCLMALMNIEPLSPLFAGLAKKLRAGGRFVSVILHPAFRSPGQTSWVWDAAPARESGPRPRFESRSKPGRPAPSPTRSADRQFRRVDGYLSSGHREIVMNPGAVSGGSERVVTLTHHRPVQTYIRLLREAGFMIDALEEWPSARESEPGPRAAEENRARREIPMFLALRAVRI